jgi:hypothetical protein
MPYTIQITPTATEDIAVGIDYYNTASPDLGYKFADGVAEFLERIAEWPTASAIRYKNIRCKPMKQFPYLNYLYNRRNCSLSKYSPGISYTPKTLILIGIIFCITVRHKVDYGR